MPRILQDLQFVLFGFFFLWAASTAAWVLPNESGNRGPSSAATTIQRRTSPRMTIALSENSLPIVIMDVSPIVVAGLALGLGVAAQGFINQMLQGDQGLGAFLTDGSGYNKSGFRRVSSSSKMEKTAADPLPWLKLPRLDFVEVVGQPPSPLEEEEALVLRRLESLRMDMNECLKQGKVAAATAYREELEALMDEAGIEYSADGR